MAAWGDIVGEEFARPGTPDDAVDGVVPSAVVRPGSAEEVQAVVREAGRSGAALVASGLGAHLDIGASPRRLDALVRLDRLCRVLDHQAADMTVTVEAGCALDALDATLAAAGQWLPLDPPLPAATTVGGLVAANLSGPLRTSQGTVRDLLIGIRVVGADGALVSGGGRVVKNVAGYDLPKLHVGALGTVGVVVSATFKVRPRPEREEAIVLRCSTAAAAVAAALAVRDRLDPLWLESGTLDDGIGVAIGLGGGAVEIEAARASVEDVARTHGLEAQRIEPGAALRSALGRFGVEPRAAAVLRASTLPTDVERVVRAVDGVADARCRVQVASGVVRIAIGDAATAVTLARRLLPALEERGGHLVVERALPAVKAVVDVWGDPGEGLGLMRRLKDAFDPEALLAPGRFIGGL